MRQGYDMAEPVIALSDGVARLHHEMDKAYQHLAKALELARYDVGLASSSISNRVALAAAFTEGWGISECAPGSPAAIEIVALASELRTAIKCADLVVVPVQPSPVDVWATLSTLEIAQSEQVPVLLVLNRVPARAALTAAMRHCMGN